MPMDLKTLDECPTVPWLEEHRATRGKEDEQNDPHACSSRDIPEGDSPRSEENLVDDSQSRVSAGKPDSVLEENPPQIDSPIGEYSSNVVRELVTDEPSAVTPWLEPEVDQSRELFADGNHPSVSYLRALLEDPGFLAAPHTPIHSTSISETDELFTLEIPTGTTMSSDPSSWQMVSPADHSGEIRFISASAFYPRRDSANNEFDDSPTDSERHERAASSRERYY